jgi:GT2 family glycosyltransferase
MNHPLVYIIVLSWNGKSDTLECLDSLCQVEYQNFRILVVDNASADGTCDAIKQRFPNVELIVNQANIRFAGGNNIGIRYAVERGADFVLLLNNDTIVDKHFLALLTDAAGTDPRVGMVGPKIYYHSDKQRLWYAGGKINWWKGLVSHIGIREIDHGQYDEQKETDYITGCCVLVRRSVIESIGMLDEKYFIYGEDADWSVRASRKGFKLLFVPSSKIWHKVSVSSGGHLSWFKNWNKLKSTFRLMGRYAMWYQWVTIPFCLFAGIVAGFVKVRSADTN